MTSDRAIILMRILPAKPQDADALTRIAFEAKRHWGYPEPWIECWRRELTIRPEHIAEHEIHVAAEDDQIVGFYTLISEHDRIFLADLFVLPKAMGKGIGRELFEHALVRASQRGFSLLEIESDPNAEGFYLRMGASHVGQKLTEVAGHSRVLPKLVCECRAD